MNKKSVKKWSKKPTKKWSKINHKSWREWNGRLCHDGDCQFWGKDICTCGLLHHLMWYADKNFGEELAIEDVRHRIQLDRTPKPKPYVKPSAKEVARRKKEIEKIFQIFAKAKKT